RRPSATSTAPSGGRDDATRHCGTSVRDDDVTCARFVCANFVESSIFIFRDPNKTRRKSRWSDDRQYGGAQNGDRINACKILETRIAELAASSDAGCVRAASASGL